MALMSEILDDAMHAVLQIAAALRNEFGVGIDGHPGGDRTEAGVVNRAFQVTVRTIVADDVQEVDQTAKIVTKLLRKVALQRLMGVGVSPEQAEMLVSSEPKLGDAWLAYMTLAPKSVIDELTR
jgi:hypothetical protein